MIRLLLLIAVICFAGVAQAQTRGGPAAICVPDALTVAGGGLRTNAASVQHATGKTGLLTLNCQIERFDDLTNSWRLKLTYVDSTGMATTAHARARLYRMAIGGNTPALLATAFSNTSAVTTLNSVESSFTQTFTFDTYVYWVRLDLQRSAGNQTVIIHSYNIQASGI